MKVHVSYSSFVSFYFEYLSTIQQLSCQVISFGHNMCLIQPFFGGKSERRNNYLIFLKNPFQELRSALRSIAEPESNHHHRPSVDRLNQLLYAVDPVERVAVVSIYYDQLGTVLHALCANGENTYLKAIVESICPEHRFIFRLPGKGSRTLLHEAATHNNSEAIRFVIQSLFSPDDRLRLLQCVSSADDTALDCAVCDGKLNKRVSAAILTSLTPRQRERLIVTSRSYQKVVATEDTFKTITEGML